MQERWHSRHTLQVILLISFAFPLHFALGQQAHPPSLDEILLRLEGNLNHYDKEVPNFFCSEHVASSLSYAKKLQSTVTDEVFRVVRTSAGTLTESHEIQAVNGTPAKVDHVGGPTSLSGVFTGGLAAVSLGQRACMRYALQPISAERLNEPYVVQFATLPSTERRSECVLKEDGTGRVLVDPATLQVMLMELKAPNHAINPVEVGRWSISINYAPVLLVGQIFWLPTAITSTAIPNDVYTPTVYSFAARYTDYHKLEVTSRIAPSQ